MIIYSCIDEYFTVTTLPTPPWFSFDKNVIFFVSKSKTIILHLRASQYGSNSNSRAMCVPFFHFYCELSGARARWNVQRMAQRIKQDESHTIGIERAASFDYKIGYKN